MDYFAFSVPKFWYRAYYVWVLVCNLVLLGASLAAEATPGLKSLKATFGIDNVILFFVGMYVLYNATAYWFIQQRSLPLATLVSALLFALTLLGAMAKTDPQNAIFIYIGVWLLSQFFNGCYGLLMLIASVLTTSVYILALGHFQPNTISRPSWILWTGTIAMSVVSYLFWRGRFVNTREQAVNRLSGMLQSDRQQSEILIESIADGVIVITTDGKISLLNSSAATMVQWPISEAVGIDVQLVVKLAAENGTAIEPDQNPFVRVLNQKEHIQQTVQLAGRDGKNQIVSLVVSPVIVPKTKALAGAVAVLRDVSEQHAVDQQRTEFISTAAHEMRTPVAAIEGYLSLALNDRVATIDSRASGYLQKAHDATQHLGKLFQDLLTSSKAEDGRLSSHPQVVEMGAFTQQITEDLRFTAEKKGLAVEFVVGSTDATANASKESSAQHVVTPLYYAMVDPDRMREVLTNLFDNACKYTTAGKISVGLTGDNEVVQLYIRDTGAGIPAEDIPHLFQKFYRVDNSATRTIGGTGLGLFICRKIVELYHGRVWVESTLGEGSTFFINLPRLSTQHAQSLQAAAQTATPAAPAVKAAAAQPAANPAPAAAPTPASPPATANTSPPATSPAAQASAPQPAAPVAASPPPAPAAAQQPSAT